MKKKYVITLVIITLMAFGVRLKGISAPVADWHSWRQVDTAAVARNFEKYGIDLLHPRYDDISNIQTGFDNPRGYRMVEMPLYQLVGVWTHRAVPQLSLEASLRLVSAVATALSVLMLGFLLFTFVGTLEAIVGSLIYAFLPYSMYYGRTILPDSFAIFWAMLSLVLLTKKHAIFLVAAGISAAISLLVRPMAAFLLLPALYLIFQQSRFSFYSLIRVFAYSLICLLPLVWWRQYWIIQFKEGIPVSNWLLNNNGIRFKGAWFHWLFAKRVGELILGFWGLIPLGVGLLFKSQKKDTFFSALWLAGALAYFIVFAGGNVQHDYYQALIVPVIIWFVAKGSRFLLKHGGIGILAISVVFGFAFSWYTIRTYFWINHPEIIEAGVAADSRLPEDAKVIAPYGGDTTFLYHTKRQGWPIGFSIEEKISLGATHYVTVSPEDDETKELAKKYTVLAQNERYVIIDLTAPKK